MYLSDFDPGPDVDFHTSNGELDIFISKFDLDGNYHWARTWGDGTIDVGYGVTVDFAGNVLATGYFAGHVDFDPGLRVEWHDTQGHPNAFILKLRPNGYWE